ncbi:FmdB family zinc ribbon protein [Nocardioides marmoribigeumensis]|uniref:FmdB family regulatory protein n=1 Tax=Nocardioides marmoribigeumensis TaxID=433649 RepID=A0ABU2BZE6_9ACTN|nr:FmdB family zinc ribbon protein [Nocardioides marmoribigeumensis]MDR7363768.1 putative FmdB family regulatory protein [Nocardioides marmoribigeumensis]
MPTYQYSCTECGHFFEQVQSFTEDSLTVCPECQGRLRKVFNAVGVVFKGSGFYRTDSRGSSSATEPSTGGTTTASGSTTGGSSGSSEKSSTTGTPSGSGSGSGSGSSGGSTAGAGVG